MKVPTEYSILLPVKRGMKGRDVRVIQEWLCLHDCKTATDSDYGAATEAAVRKFQTKSKLLQTGVVDELTLRALIAPITRACRALETTAETFSQRVVSAGRQHLKEHPVEVGGANRGPWVRLYCGGKDGEAYAWCAGFVSTLLAQAQESMKKKADTISGSLSCDELAKQAKAKGTFVPEQALKNGIVKYSDMGPGTIFLKRSAKSATDWIHTGIVLAFHPEYMETIEGNTNDAGDREGYEVCRRIRGFAGIDYIKL